MSKIKTVIKNRRNGKEIVCGGSELIVVFPYGLSSAASSVGEELEKVKLAEKLGVNIVKDNSVGRKEWFSLLEQVSKETNLPIGASATLAAGNLAMEAGKSPTDLSEELFFKGFERLAKVCDLIEVFPTITKESLKVFSRSNRIIDTVISRAGNLIANYIQTTGCENPFYKDFDWFVEEAKEKEITLIFGNGLRAACIKDSFDEAQMYEGKIVKEFSQKVIEKNAKAIAGIFGHIDPSKIEFIKRIREEIPIPLGGLGPLATDIALGYDHINAAVTLTMFREYIDWVSIITPAEHIGMPSLQDAADGITAFNIAKHIFGLAKGKNQEKDLQMAIARKNTSWCVGMPEIAINPYLPRINHFSKQRKAGGCTICGSWCPFLNKPKGTENETPLVPAIEPGNKHDS